MKFIFGQLSMVWVLMMLSVSSAQNNTYYIDDQCVWPTEFNIYALTGVGTGNGCAKICVAMPACTHFSWTNDNACVLARAPKSN